MSELEQPSVGAMMRRVHSAVTRGLAVCQDRATEFAEKGYPDAMTRHGFALYIQSLVSVLSAHHLAEDEIAFPALRAKLPDVPFDKLMADHQVMESMLNELRAIVAAVEAEEQPNHPLGRVHDITLSLADLWHPHIQIEERDIYNGRAIPAIMDASAERRLGEQLAQHAQQHVDPPFLGVPWLLYNMAPEVRAIFAAQTMPPMVTEQLVPFAWKEQWAPMQPFLLG